MKKIWPLQDLLDKAEAAWDAKFRYRGILTEAASKAQNYKDASRYVKEATAPATDLEMEAKENLDRLARQRNKWLEEQNEKS